MKSYSRPGKKSKTYSKAIVSIKLSDVQHLEKLGIRKCFVELKRLKPGDYGLSEISSSSPNIEKKPIAKNKVKNPNKKPRDRSKRIHLDSEIIKNGTQTLHYETLENPTDHTQLQERKGQEQAKESNPTEVDLAKKRKTGSFSNLNTETQNLDFESSEVRVTGHEVSKEIKLIDRGKKRKNKSGNFSNTSKETLNSATVLESHQEEQKIDQKQTRRKKKNRTSIESKREVQNLDFECSETVLSSLGQTEESSLTEIDLFKKNSTESSSSSNRETQNFVSENSEEILSIHKADKRSQVETQKRKQKKNKSSDSISETHNFDSECSETQNLDFQSSEVKLTNHETTKEINLIDRGKRRNNRSGHSSNTSKETQNSVSEYSETILGHEEEEKVGQKQTRRKKKNRTSIESKREVQNLDFECSETVLSSLGQTEKSNLTEIELSKKNNTESSSTSNRETQNFDSENAEEMLAAHEKPDEKSQVETQKGKRKKNKSSDSNSGTHNLDSECSETQNLDCESSDVKLTDRQSAKEIKLIDRGKRRNNRSGHSSDTSKETLNTVSECSETILEIHEGKKVSQKQTRKKKKNRTSFDSKREVQNLDFECSETVLESTVSSPCQLGESTLAETDLSKKNNTEISCSSYSKTQNFHSENSDGTLADEGSQVETQKRKWKTNRSSSDSNSEICNLDSECSESVLASHKRADENINIQTGRQKKNRSVSNSSRETQNFDSESLETVLSKRHLCSEEMLPKPEHLKNISKTKTRRSRLKKCNTSSSDSNRETWNSDSEATETILINSEQTDDSSLRETELPRKSRSRSASNSNSETLNFNSECSKTVPAGHKQTETVKAALLRKNRIRSSSTSSCGSQNVSSECSETVLPSCKQAEESNLTEIHLLKKAITRNSCIEGEMLESECKEILDHHEQPEEVRQAAAKRKKNIISSKLKRGILNLDPESSESAPISHQKAEKINHVQTRSRKRNRSPSDSSRETQNVDSVCSETIIVNHEQGVKASLIEIDLIENTIPSGSSRRTENTGSGCSEAILTDDEQIGEICLTSSTVGRRNRSGSYSNSSEGTQSLNSKYSENMLASSEQAERKNIISYKSKKRILNLDPESSESAPISHQKAEKINHVLTRSRKRNRSPSDSSRETQNVNSECSEVLLVNHEQGVKASLIEIDLIENTIPSGSSRRTENTRSGCSEAILTSAEQIGEICLTSTTVGRRNRTGSSSNSSQGIQSLNSEYSETMLARSEQAEVSSLTETDLSNKKRSRSSSDSSKEIQNLDSEFSGEPDSSTHVQSAILMSQVNLPVIKRVRNSSNPSNCLPQVQSSHFEEKDDEQLSQALKEKKKHINYAPVQKTNKKKSIFPTPRITRNSSNLNRNKNFHSALSKMHTGHRQTQKIKPIHQSNLLAKKRFQNNAQISHLEYSEEHLEPEQTQDFFLDSHLPTEKKAKKSLNNSFQNSDSESSEKHNEILQTQEFSLDSNLSSKTESRSPFSSSSMVQPSDFLEKQNEHMQTNDSNQPEEDLCVKKSNSVSDLDNKIVESVLEFSKQNGIEDNIEEQEKPENLIGSDSLAQEKIKTFYSSNEKISTLNSENNYVKNYPAENAKQDFSVANFSLNSKCENSASEHLEKENFENELERNIYHTHLEDVVVQQSISQNTARTSLCASNQTNLLDSEILKSTDIEKDIEVQRDLLEKQGECFTENNVSVQNTVAQETCVDYENSEFGFSLVDGADKEMENLEKPVETLGNLPNYETHVQSRSRAADSNIKHSELNVDEDNFEKQDHDIESPITSEEESDFSDAALLKKYGIKECSVVLTRAKPFIIHYGRPFLKEVAQVEYRSNRKTKHPNLDGLFRRRRLSQFSSLSKEAFKREIKNCLQRLRLRDEFISKRLELINSDEAQLIEYKENYKRKIIYDKRNNGFVIVNENLIQEKRKALRNELFSYPFVLIERNEEAEFLVRKYMKRMSIEPNRIGKEEVLDYNDYRETNQYSEGEESGNESDQSDNEETNLNADHNDDYVLQIHTRRSKDSLKESKELQDSNLDCKESHIDRQKLFIDMQPDLETGMMQNYEDATNCVNSKSCESLQNQNLPDLNSTLESEHYFLALHSDRSKEGIKESPWPQVLLCPVKRTTENDQANSPSPALSEVDFIPFQQPGDSEQTNATNVLKEVAYNESTSECNPPSSGRETPLSMDHFDDAGEKKSFGTASEEFVVIDEDDDDSEKKSCCSFSEEGSEPDQQLCTTECQGSHQNSSLCPS